jgi:hypothetical protein
MAIDLRYAEVKCAKCGKEYQCTPSQDYFHPDGKFIGEDFDHFPPDKKTTDNGYCWDCFLEVTGMKSQPEPPYA